MSPLGPRSRSRACRAARRSPGTPGMPPPWLGSCGAEGLGSARTPLPPGPLRPSCAHLGCSPSPTRPFSPPGVPALGVSISGSSSCFDMGPACFSRPGDIGRAPAQPWPWPGAWLGQEQAPKGQQGVGRGRAPGTSSCSAALPFTTFLSSFFCRERRAVRGSGSSGQEGSAESPMS